MFGFLIGCIIGIVIVRAFFLDEIEVIGFDLFWESAKEGKLSFDRETILNSSSFMKCCIGFIIGGLIGRAAQNSISEDDE